MKLLNVFTADFFFVLTYYLKKRYALFKDSGYFSINNILKLFGNSKVYRPYCLQLSNVFNAPHFYSDDLKLADGRLK